MYVFVWTCHSFLSYNYLGEESLGHRVGECLLFKESIKLFYKIDVPFYNLISFVQESYILTNTCPLSVF